ncbi:MarR family winged helix-turn-helix transcriptional regulator [Kitasatospora sp. NPDC091335]|uniref:MarR family winged helix-turn-helix transcriptional regulator n=1 Tax=Kitasatospora sp. NPDC091335 TaxID=3364085 RepID=UPI003818B416
MKQVNKSGETATGPLGRDAEGRLYDSRVRTAMGVFTKGGDTLALEAAAAARSAFHAVERLRAHGSQRRGLSAGALDVLVRLGAAREAGEADESGLTVGELARAGGVSPRNATGLVDTLEREGLARRSPDPDDRRAVLVTATAEGLAWLEEFRVPTERAMAAVFRGFDPDELAQLRHLCLRLVENQQQIEQYLTAVADGPGQEVS